VCHRQRLHPNVVWHAGWSEFTVTRQWLSSQYTNVAAWAVPGDDSIICGILMVKKGTLLPWSLMKQHKRKRMTHSTHIAGEAIVSSWLVEASKQKQATHKTEIRLFEWVGSSVSLCVGVREWGRCMRMTLTLKKMLRGSVTARHYVLSSCVDSKDRFVRWFGLKSKKVLMYNLARCFLRFFWLIGICEYVNVVDVWVFVRVYIHISIHIIWVGLREFAELVVENTESPSL
jgi:hypothetical protein